MKLLLINIALRPESALKLFPTGLAYVASAIHRAGFDLEILDIDVNRYSDQQVEQFLEARDFDVVAMGCIVTGYKFVKNLAQLLRRVNDDAVIIAGNSVASSIPELLLTRTEVDIAVMGEGEETVVDLLHCLDKRQSLHEVSGICFLEGGKPVRTPERPVIQDLDSIPHPDWELFDMETYIVGGRAMLCEPLPMKREVVRPFHVNTARGCLYRCTFCYHTFRNRRYRTRSAASIISEMQALRDIYNVNYIHFWDELTFYSISQADEIISALIEADLGLFWVADIRGNMFRDEKGLKLAQSMRRAGCVGLAYSLESANPEILRMMDKKITPANFLTQKRILDEAGIASWTSLVFAYPQETPETIRETLECCRQAEIYPSAGYLLPQPGTPMYDYACLHGFIRDEEEYLLSIGDRQDLHVNLTKMADDELTGYVQQGLKELNEHLDIGLNEGSLIKTGYYRKHKEMAESGTS